MFTEGMLARGRGCFLLTEDFDYELPEGRIATHPAHRRDASRLLILSRDDGEHNHAFFGDLPRFLRQGSLLVLNDARVIPARLSAWKPTGGRVEVFLVEPASPSDGAQGPDGAASPAKSNADSWAELWHVLVRGLGRTPVGTPLTFVDPADTSGAGPLARLHAVVHARNDRGNAVLRFSGEGQGGLLAAIETEGNIPLPPYIEAARQKLGHVPEIDDRSRYQTVYARAPGAVAAPTAGLHFTDELLADIERQGHEIARITLHVGPGTFRPVTSSDPSRHRLDPERFEVSDEAAVRIRRAQAEGRPIVAVGTTVVRTLEALARDGGIRAASGRTGLLILPGDEFRVVTDLVTNFHLPKSSLLMLVAAFAGRERVLSAYSEAIAQGYRFYSYGDAMFIRPGSARS